MALADYADKMNRMAWSLDANNSLTVKGNGQVNQLVMDMIIASLRQEVGFTGGTPLRAAHERQAIPSQALNSSFTVQLRAAEAQKVRELLLPLGVDLSNSVQTGQHLR